jgi:hypothetical protein
MGEIAALVQQAIPDLIDTVCAPETGGELHFRHIYLDMTRGLYVGRDIGTVLLVDTLVEDDGVDTTTAGAGDAGVDGDVKMEGEGEGEKADKPGEAGAKKEEGGQGLAEVDQAQGLLTKDIRKSKDSASAAASALATAITAATAQATTTTTTAGPTAGKRSTALEKTLSSIRFVIGDYLDISIVSRVGGRPGAAVAGGTGGGREQALFTGRQGRSQRGGSGPMRRSREGRRRERRREGGGGGDGGGGRVSDRFAGRLGLMEPLERNGHGSHAGGRRGVADSEASWKGRGRGR